MESGCFSKYQFVRLIEIEEDDGPTYALQLYAAGKEKYEYYIANSMAENEALSYEKWQNSVLSFSTLMEIVN